MNNQAPALRRAQAYRNLRLAKDIGSMSYILTYRQHHIVHNRDTITSESLTIGPDAIDLVPQPLFHGESSRYHGGQADATTDSIFDYHEQDNSSEDGLEPFPVYDDAYASGMLEPRYASEAIALPQYVEYDDKDLTIEAIEDDVVTDPNNGGSSLSTEESVNESESTARVQQEMLATLHGFPYDMRAPRTSRQPRSCARVVKSWVRRLMKW
ncbi:hypothetical protein LTR56_021144 [Elasticomyces elasticus]|nr:hypothetical protein LTR56_021144 [Elasticomyces elasticus]KAK3631819.1 hypothetical protein LTR22_020887 [Elasticomyces elasticus]KAK5749537.1 hypothetical protein LTS12_020403 [Elasticomyces elasticus]